jgi:tetratricopeptide (TPR) repeat protein
MTSNESLAAGLHDDDDEVRQLAVEALWQVWFRADGEDSARELRRLAHVTDRARLLAGLDELIARSPAFAEAYNQRAILFFQMHQPERAVADCEMVLALNPYHFGAQVGMARCLLQQGRRRAALRAFRRARRLHPGLEGVDEIIRNLEAALGEDDKK